MDKLQLEKVKKTIAGNIVLDGIDMEFEKGNVYGIVGQNGSGKTMLFRAISGLMKIDEGVIKADDLVLHKDVSVFENVGLVLENAGLYPEFTGLQNLMFLSEINKKVGREEICECIKKVGLDPDDKRPIKKYSLGMKQRIVLAQALMEKPELLLLDEPTNALDEDGVELIRTLIEEEKKKGTIVLVASHNREDIDLLCDKVFVMKKGKLNLCEQINEER